MFAAATGHMVIVQVLLEGGARVNTEARNGSTVKMEAESERHPDIAQLLRQAGEKEVGRPVLRATQDELPHLAFLH